MSDNTKVILKRDKEKSLLRFHPWVFSGAVHGVTGELNDGDIVDVYDADKNFLASGHYQKEGSIVVRIFSFVKTNIDNDFWKAKLSDAIALRKRIGLFDNKQSNAFRLVHGEGDEMPGLVIDYYNGVAVIQFHSFGMYLLKDVFTQLLVELLADNLIAVYNKSSSTLPRDSKEHSKDEYLYQKSPFDNIITEYGNQYYIDIVEGQKTGFFIDQKESRKLLENYCTNANVLNMFCYTGGFSVAALKGNASLVHSVDSSVKAIDLTNKNIELNFGSTTKHQSFSTDAFDYLDELKKDFFDVIILDPPAFSKHLQSKEKGLKGYKNINNKAFFNIKKGGIVFTFSCSQAVSKEEFRTMIFSAAANSGRKVKIIHQLTQGADHPINIYHPEGEYLKGLALYVE